MLLKNYPELSAFLSTYFADSDSDADEQSVRSFIAASPSDRQEKVVAQAKLVFAGAELSLEELGTVANRWFGDVEEAREWGSRLLGFLEGAQSSTQAEVKDSNGAPLSEGDSVLVIKDLKVRGGSSDLKRGTMIKKIHLIDDPEAIECRVDGSTLVLKTCFLKKA